MPFSPKIIRILPDTEVNNLQMTTLKLQHNFQPQQEPVKTINFEEKSRQIIAEAEAKAKKILEETRQAAEKEARQLAENAREEAYQQGYKEALEKARQEAAIIRDQAQKVLKQAQEQKTEIIDSLEQEIVTLSIDIAEKILAQQLTIQPEVVISIAREAIQLVKNTNIVIIYHHPSDTESFEQYSKDLQKLLPADTSLSFITDEAITPGGCVVETEHGRVEATLESRWQSVFENLGLEAINNYSEN